MTPLTKRLVVALSLSVGLNLFLVGLGTAHLLGRRHRVARPRALFGLDDGNPQLRQRYRSYREKLRPHRKTLRKSRKAVRQAVSAEPFDREALERSLAQLRSDSDRSQQALHAALVELASDLDASQRKRLGRSFMRGRRPFGRRGPGREGPSGAARPAPGP